jgi:hypothetical protein
VGTAATGFCYPGGILQVFHRQDQQILRLPTAAAGTHLAKSSATSDHHRQYSLAAGDFEFVKAKSMAY